MKESWDAKQLVPYIAGPYNQPKAGVENVRSMKYKVKIETNNGSNQFDRFLFHFRRITSSKII